MDWERYTEADACKDIGGTCEKECRRKRNGICEDEGDHQRKQSPKVAQGARELGEGGAAEGVDIVRMNAAKAGTGIQVSHADIHGYRYAQEVEYNIQYEQKQREETSVMKCGKGEYEQRREKVLQVRERES